MLKPEEKSRLKIDSMLKEAGWSIVDRAHYNPSDSAVAITEGLIHGRLEADYLLFIEGKAVGVLEAKREESNLAQEVEAQAENYTHKLDAWYPAWQRPLPLTYLSNGKKILYKNINGIQKYESITHMHTPKEIAALLNLPSFFAGLPALSSKGLRNCQYEAIYELEKSFRKGEKRALMVLATGSGKTYTACTIAYRLLSYTPAKRVLFLVDRNNLGVQAEGEFCSYRLTETGDTFNTIYATQRLRSKDIPVESNVVISTIQRLFSAITGRDIEEDEDAESAEFDEDYSEIEENLGEDLKLSPDFFDFIIIDECHRSIYGKWKQVLNYFSSARIIGLTATPTPEAEAFFNKNRVSNYSLEKSIVDGINVDCRVYRIKTKVSEKGRVLSAGENYTEHSNYNNTASKKIAKENTTYRKEQLNRDIIDLKQIKLVLETYKDAIYKDLYPNREVDFRYIPKTLIFAQSDQHADSVIEVIREVFSNQSPNFARKITYSAGNSNDLIRSFRNDKDFRIAVTVTLVATGTDVKPLEVIMFLRDVKSFTLYTQMKGRGVRTIGDEKLRNVTPNADTKDFFYVIDAVGVTEHAHEIVINGGGVGPKIKTLKELLEEIAHGNIPDEYLQDLAGKISRIYKKSSQEQRDKFFKLARIDMQDLAARFYNALTENKLPPFSNVNDQNIERKELVEPLTEHPDAREYLVKLNAGFIKILTQEEDFLIDKGFSVEEAQSAIAKFEEYIMDHKDDIEALRIIYNDLKEELTYDVLKDLYEKLQDYDYKFKIATLWNSYSILNPKYVTKFETKEQRDALTNIISLVRYAFKTTNELKCFVAQVSQKFELWCGQKQREYPLTYFQRTIILQIVHYIANNGALSVEEMRNNTANIQLLANYKKAFGGMQSLPNTLSSLSGFILSA